MVLYHTADEKVRVPFGSKIIKIRTYAKILRSWRVKLSSYNRVSKVEFGTLGMKFWNFLNFCRIKWWKKEIVVMNERWWWTTTKKISYHFLYMFDFLQFCNNVWNHFRKKKKTNRDNTVKVETSHFETRPNGSSHDLSLRNCISHHSISS